MERLPPPDRVPVTAEWLAEQRAKQEAYAARRRDWVRAARVEEQQEPEELPPAATEAAAPSPDALAPPQRRPRGPVHDPRQRKLEF